MEAKGYRHEVNKYIVKLASVTSSSSSKGIIVEVCGTLIALAHDELGFTF